MEFFYHVFLIRDLILIVEKVKAKSLLQQMTQPEPKFILVSIAWSNWGYHCSPLDASPSQGYAPPLPPTFHQVSLTICQYPFILLGGARHSEGKLFCWRTQYFDLARSWSQNSRLRVQCTNHWSILLPWMYRRGGFSIFMSVKLWQFQ